ncbi:sugar phosphate isomerase/epimerase family protein [Paenibacillus silvisoli]|uniref:sugar phosphate isomerase/epimerase family protein n=1 Tax=Paenibacillus silvisoli TaxID=3110539 RepID=UPI002805EED6|nr:sugar phosphate isomerase/epimerase [Paenibacillus silvisoli]
MGIGVFSIFYHDLTPEAMARQIKEQGFDAVQLYLNMSEVPGHPSELDDAACDRIKEAFASEGVSIATLGAFGNIAHPDPSRQKEAIDLVKQACKWAARIGTDSVSTMTGSYNAEDEWSDHEFNHTQEALERLIPVVKDLAQTAGEHGLKLCLEPYYHSIADTAERTRLLIEASGSNVGVMYDPAAMVGPDRIRDSAQALRDDFRILFDSFLVAHVEDVAFIDGKPQFVLPGKGGIDWDEYYRLLRVYRWRGPTIIEIHEQLDTQLSQVKRGLGIA